MFDVSWSDPTRETVGQRRHRKEHDANAATPAASTRTSASSDSSKSKRRPSILTLFNGSRKNFSRPTTRAQVSVREREPVGEPPFSRASQVAEAISPIQELHPGTLASDILDRFLVTELSYVRDGDKYSPSDGASFQRDVAKLNTADA